MKLFIHVFLLFTWLFLNTSCKTTSPNKDSGVNSEELDEAPKKVRTVTLPRYHSADFEASLSIGSHLITLLNEASNYRKENAICHFGPDVQDSSAGDACRLKMAIENYEKFSEDYAMFGEDVQYLENFLAKFSSKLVGDDLVQGEYKLNDYQASIQGIKVGNVQCHRAISYGHAIMPKDLNGLGKEKERADWALRINQNSCNYTEGQFSGSECQDAFRAIYFNYASRAFTNWASINENIRYLKDENGSEHRMIYAFSERFGEYSNYYFEAKYNISSKLWECDLKTSRDGHQPF